MGNPELGATLNFNVWNLMKIENIVNSKNENLCFELRRLLELLGLLKKSFQTHTPGPFFDNIHFKLVNRVCKFTKAMPRICLDMCKRIKEDESQKS